MSGREIIEKTNKPETFGQVVRETASLLLILPFHTRTDNQRSVGSVSYTHLDVYKRQERNNWWAAHKQK